MASAQENAERQRSLFFDTVDVNVVNLEVIVTDKKGQPVTGLGRDDFEVFEDGKLMQLTNFFAVEGREAQPLGEPGGSPRSGELSPVPDTRRLNLVLYVDNFNLQPRNRNLIFEKLADYLHENLDPRDRVMLVTFTNRIQVVQGFTNDPLPLLEELDELRSTTGNRMVYDNERRRIVSQMQRVQLNSRESEDALASNNGFEYTRRMATALAGDIRLLAEQSHQRTLATLAALGQFTDMLAGMRGRKAVLYVSDGIHQRSGESLAQAWINKFESWATQNNVPEVMIDINTLSSQPHDATQDFHSLVDHASSNQVAFYPISNGGRFASSSVSAEFGGVSTADGRGPRSVDVTALENATLEGSLLELAQGTGGLAFTRTANIGGLLERIAGDFTTFYSLGYSRPHDADEDFHRIDVKVKGKGLVVRHLRGYRDKDPLTHLKDLTLSALSLGIEDNPLEVSLDLGEPVKEKGRRYRVPVLIKIPFKALLLLPEEKHHVAHLTAFVVAQDDRGGISKFQQIELPIRIPNEQILQAMGQTAAYPMELRMERGKKKLSVGIRDHLARVDSTVSLDVTVGEGGD